MVVVFLAYVMGNETIRFPVFPSARLPGESTVDQLEGKVAQWTSHPVRLPLWPPY